MVVTKASETFPGSFPIPGSPALRAGGGGVASAMARVRYRGIRYRPLSGRYDEGPPRGPIRASLLPAFWPSQSTCRFRPMTWTPSDTTDAIQSVVGLALPFANDGLLQFARGGSLMETVYQNCTTGRSNLFESHRQRRWLTVVSYNRIWCLGRLKKSGVSG